MTEEALSHHESGMLSNKIFNQRINSDSTFELGKFSVPEDFIAKLENLPSLSSSTRLLIDEALRRSNGNQTIAAKLLGISKQALSRRLKNMK
jgi:transcriptional regulator with PAS, ATPase and Fis domain